MTTIAARTRHARAVLVLACVALSVCIGAGCKDSTQKSRRERYRIGARTVELDLELDRIGLVLRVQATRPQLLSVLAPGTALLGMLRNRIQVLDPPGDLGADELLAFARALRRRAPALIEHVGILATPVGSKQPLILTHELIVEFVAAATDEDIAALLRKYRVEELKKSAFDERVRVVGTQAGSDVGVFDACRGLEAEPLVEYAEPNFVHAVEYLSDGSGDPLFPYQWHLDNTGQGGGTIDADIDAPEAWKITRGSRDVVIAVLEDGFDAEHPDLAPNLWSDPSKPGEHGWDFEDDDDTLEGDPTDRGAAAHGTAVAGCAGARGDNGIGVCGSCPECRLMLIRRSHTAFRDGEAIRYARSHGADIITNSWTYPEFHPVTKTVLKAIEDAATKGRDGKGCVILFGVRNEAVDVSKLDDIASLDSVIAVGSITNTDERTRVCGFGPCLDVLGPSRLSQAPNYTEGTLDIATTDWRGRDRGYNSDEELQVKRDDGWAPCEEISTTNDYTLCFGGASAATPIVAGVVGLVLAADPELTRVQVQRLLQDTADRAEDSRAAYADSNGYSTKNTHGNGRVNAFEAVRVVASEDHGGRGGVDVFVRDNRLDWGNTEQPSHVLFERQRGVIGHWQSPDIKVDAPPLASAPTTSAEFDAFVDENPLVGFTNRVYVRVRNRGPKPAHDVVVELDSAPGGTALPPLWVDSGDGGKWQVLGAQAFATVPYSGASVAGTTDDGAAVATFELSPPADDANSEPKAIGLLAIVDCDEDPVSNTSREAGIVDVLTPTDNNIALREVIALDPAHTTGVSTVLLRVRNPYDVPITSRLELVAASATHACVEPVHPPGPTMISPAPTADASQPNPTSARSVIGDPFSLEPGAEIAVRIVIESGSGAVELRQWRMEDAGRTLLGGVTYPALR